MISSTSTWWMSKMSALATTRVSLSRWLHSELLGSSTRVRVRSSFRVSTWTKIWNTTRFLQSIWLLSSCTENTKTFCLDNCCQLSFSKPFSSRLWSTFSKAITSSSGSTSPSTTNNSGLLVMRTPKSSKLPLGYCWSSTQEWWSSWFTSNTCFSLTWDSTTLRDSTVLLR